MASRELDLTEFEKYAKYVQLAPAADGRKRPIRCRIVGGKPEYSNVAKLPQLLWDMYRIVVVDHTPADDQPSGESVALSVVLIDQCSTKAKENVADYSDQCIYAPSAWAKITEALNRVGIREYRSDLLPPEPKVVEEIVEGGSRRARAAVRNEPVGVVTPPAAQLPHEPEPEPPPEPGPEPEPPPEPGPEPEPESERFACVLTEGQQAELLQIRSALDTPAVRAVTGASVDEAAAFRIIFQRGVAAILESLTK